MGGTIVGDKEYMVRGTIRLLPHDLSDKAFERGNADLALTPPEQPCAMDIPGREISQRAGSRIFVFDTQGTPRRSSK